jgi:hypothetical protein
MRSIKKFEKDRIWIPESNDLLKEYQEGMTGHKVVQLDDHLALYKALQEERKAHIASVKRYKAAIRYMKMMNVFNIFSKKWFR